MKGNKNMNNNEQPNYVLKFNDSVLKRIEDKNSKIKKAVVVIIAIIVIGSIILGENLFLELSWTVRILLICLAIGLLFSSKSEEIAIPVELQFYNDYLILFRPNKYYSKKVSRQEFFKIDYKDITKCKFLVNSPSKRIHIYGNVHAVWYNLNKDGSLPQQPTYDKNVNETLIYFTTFQNTNIDFVKEIEDHSPIKVEIEET